jgi:hypothetical protein
MYKTINLIKILYTKNKIKKQNKIKKFFGYIQIFQNGYNYFNISKFLTHHEYRGNDIIYIFIFLHNNYKLNNIYHKNDRTFPLLITQMRFYQESDQILLFNISEMKKHKKSQKLTKKQINYMLLNGL